MVIPNWNGRDLLERYLPSVVEAMAGNPDNEIIVVDNGSDGRQRRIPARSTFHPCACWRSIEISDSAADPMPDFAPPRTTSWSCSIATCASQPDFLAPLLAGFTDAKVFAVSCQIFFSDPAKLREETGLTQGWWENGGLRVRHRDDPAITDLYPCFYGGGGSCAFDRRKFLELGGFDELLRPFYLEDTDLGYLAWKRGWKVLYQPRSVVYHEHRGTIGKTILRNRRSTLVLKKNFILFCWKNIHEWPRLWSHFFFTFAGAVLSVFFGDSPERPICGACGEHSSSCLARSALARAPARLPPSPTRKRFAGRWAAISATASQRSRSGPEKLSVLFVSPYPICPPVHGGGVFMYQTALELMPLCSLHLVILLDHEWERWDHAELEADGGLGRVPGAHGRQAEGVRIHPSFRGARVRERRISNGCCIARSTRAPSTWCSSNTPRSANIIGIFTASPACFSSTTSTSNPSAGVSRERAA